MHEILRYGGSPLRCTDMVVCQIISMRKHIEKNVLKATYFINFWNCNHALAREELKEGKIEPSGWSLPCFLFLRKSSFEFSSVNYN